MFNSKKRSHKLIVPSPFRVQISLRDPLTNQDPFSRWASTHVSKIINDFHDSVKSIADLIKKAGRRQPRDKLGTGEQQAAAFASWLRRAKEDRGRNPTSQAPNLRVSGVGCQVSGKRNIEAET